MRVGDAIVDAVLVDQNGNDVRLSEASGPKGMVVFFYPRDGTPVCTREACSFRDNYAGFKDLGFTVLGVSSDSSESHAKFADRHGLSFPLLWDRDGSLRSLWKVPKTMGVLPGRVTYVIDAAGRVRDIFSSQLEAGRHVTNALEAAKRVAE